MMATKQQSTRRDSAFKPICLEKQHCNDANTHLQSSDHDKDPFLPDSAATAVAVLKAEESQEDSPEESLEEPPTASDQQPSRQQGMPEDVCPDNLLERSSAGENIVLLGEKFRISSSQWAKDFEGEPGDPGPADPSVFDTTIVSMPPVPMSLIVDTIPTTSPTKFAPKMNTSPTPSSMVSKKKKRKTRVLDVTRVIEPTDGDVKFGRGSGTNNHPGNRRFRDHARELWSVYKHATKTERKDIANVLVESVKNEGHRFVEKGEDNQWHEVIFGQHTKASQTFRDLHKHF
ncbi:hypothetical protein ACHAXR_009537 [Thalassiosira sp. AJA248-18]